MVTVQSRHCIVICNNKVFCLHGGKAWTEILDSYGTLYMEIIRTKNVHSISEMD